MAGERDHGAPRGAAAVQLAGTIAVCAALAGCVGGPGPERARTPGAPVVHGAVRSLGDEIALRAMAQIGTAYRYGGADLEGFDCSGLVYFIHQELGLAAPRTAHQQFEASRRIDRNDLAPGDLVFFRFSGRRISHVGIYAGEGRFIHAPQTGRTIELKPLADTYYSRHFAGAGRLYPRDGSS